MLAFLWMQKKGVDGPAKSGHAGFLSAERVQSRLMSFRQSWQVGVTIFFVTTLSNCNITHDKSEEQGTVSPAGTLFSASCKSPRPRVCTMIYDPVCASLSNGKKVTYSSACNACADIRVVSWELRTCGE